jgi:hypothetical protein
MPIFPTYAAGTFVKNYVWGGGPMIICLKNISGLYMYGYID